MVGVAGFEPATPCVPNGILSERIIEFAAFFVLVFERSSRFFSRYSAGRMRDVEQFSLVCSYFRTTNPRTIFEDEK